ncbi:MAG TPA: alpha/beta hydrolase [Actinoplanes sp.]|nr:alpha/beta hydrolase [Actinoplanes sp.]
MTSTTEPTVTHVASPDGTEIAVFISGRGRPLVVAPGTTSDHTTWRFVLPFLEPYVAVHAVDRRGRGLSGDRPDYTLAKEYADLAAVVDAAAAATGSRVDLLGHSYGGNVAFGAATRTANIRKLVLYEGWPVPNIGHRTFAPELLPHLESLLAAGEPARMLETFYRDIVMMSPAEIVAIKSAPTWPARVAAAHTVPREIRAFGQQALDPAWAAKIKVPVLLLVGTDSPPEIKADPDVVAAALPDARIGLLQGQTHVAHLTAPETFAAHVLSFLSEGEPDADGR